MKNYKLMTVNDEVTRIERITNGSISREKIEKDEIARRKERQKILLDDIPAMYKDAELQSFGYIGDDINDTLEDLFSSRDGSAKGMILVGPAGSGKSYAMYAIWRWLAECDPAKCILMDNYAEFLQDVRYEFSNDLYFQTGSVWDRVTNGREHQGVVMLDDIGTSKFSDFELEKLYLVLDGRIADYEPIILATNLGVDVDFKDVYGDRIGSRMNILKKIALPDRDLRKALGAQNK